MISIRIFLILKEKYTLVRVIELSCQKRQFHQPQNLEEADILEEACAR